MSRRVLATALALLLQAGLTAAQAQAPNCKNLLPLPPGLSFPAVSSTLPFDATFPNIPPPNNPTIPQIQQAFDIFSWASFVALNWPSNPDGTPMSGPITSNPTAPRVWEAYIDSTGVFKAQGAAPDPWGGTNTLLASVVPNYKQHQKVLFAASKNVLSEVLEPNFGEAVFGPIADLNSKYVFYEIHLNKPEYDYIVCPTQPCSPSINLYSQDGQTAFLASNPTISFPQSSSSANGAIEVKAAWKQLGLNDDQTKFYTVTATLIDPVTKAQSNQQMGLVGLHIITRTGSAAQWVWSTFEHVLNAPDVGATALLPHYNFNDPTQTQSPNGFVKQGSNPPTANPEPTQITRVLNNTLINDPWTQCLNSTMQAELTGTVWANYRLVTTQWPNQVSQTEVDFIPKNLTNTTMETYVQHPGFSASCMNCHNLAHTAGTLPNTTKAFANFSYLLQYAQSPTAAPAKLRSPGK
jgi:hypothetical protein